MILAVDYGTSNTLAALASTEGAGAPLPLDPTAVDPTVFRSLLYFPDASACFYGQRAISEYLEHLGDGRLIRSIKKFLPSKEYLGTWIDNRLVRIEDLVGFFLLETKKRSEAAIDRELTSILLGRPARYAEDPSADQLAVFRMEKAARFAGFKDVFFFEEPLAAALDLRSTLTDWKTVLVVDLGGGTSDFTVMRIGPEAFHKDHVWAKGGISLAGDAVDGRVMHQIFAIDFGSRVRYQVPLSRNLLEMPKSLLDKICSPADITQLAKDDYMNFLKQIEQWTKREPDKKALRRLFTLCEEQLGFSFFESLEELKKNMSSVPLYDFSYPHSGIELSRQVNESEFADAIADTLDRILKCMDEVIHASGISPEKIDLVYCTGGTSRLKWIQSKLIAKFGPEKVQANKYFHSVIAGLTARARELL